MSAIIELEKLNRQIKTTELALAQLKSEKIDLEQETEKERMKLFLNELNDYPPKAKSMQGILIETKSIWRGLDLSLSLAKQIVIMWQNS